MENKQHKFSMTGIVFGSIALLLALAHFWAGPFSSQPTLEQVVAEKAVSIKQATIAALKGEKAEPQKSAPMNFDGVVSLATAILGGLAVILGVFGYSRKEPMRVAGGAVLLGGFAIAFQFVAAALIAIIIAILVAAVLSQIGFG